MKDTTIKFRFICEDKTYSQFTLIKTIYELIDKGLNESRVSSVKRVDRFAGEQDSKGSDVYENDILKTVKGDSYYKVQLYNGELCGVSNNGDEFGQFRLNFNSGINKEPFIVVTS